jgi:hypothetical protein
MTNYEISGNLCSFGEESIPQLLQQHPQFLACTDVTIFDVRNNSALHTDFIATNLNNVSAL